MKIDVSIAVVVSITISITSDKMVTTHNIRLTVVVTIAMGLKAFGY